MFVVKTKLLSCSHKPKLKPMRRISFLLTVFLLIANSSIYAANKITVASGTWNTPAVWGGSVPVAGDNITISVGHTVTLNVTTPSIAIAIINGTLSFDASGTGRTFIITGTLSINGGGIFNCVSPGIATTHALNFNGTSFINNGTINMFNATNVCNVVFGGAVAQTISGNGSTVFNKLKLNNTGGKFSITYGGGAFSSTISNTTKVLTGFTVNDSLIISRGLMIMNGQNNSSLVHTVGHLRMGSTTSAMSSSIDILSGSVTIDVNTALIMNDAANAGETLNVNGVFQSPNMTQSNSAIAFAMLGPNSDGGANNKTICNFNGDVNIPDLLGIVGNTRLYTGTDPKRPQLNFSGNVYIQYLKSYTIDIPLTSQDIFIKSFYFGLFDSLGTHPIITLNGGTEALPKIWNVPFTVFDAPIQYSNPPIGNPIVALISESASDWVVNGVREIVSGSSMAVHSNDTLKVNGKIIVDSNGEIAGSETETDSSGFISTAGPLLLFGTNGTIKVLNSTLGNGLLTEAASNVAIKNRTADFNWDLNAINNSGKIQYSSATSQTITARTYNKLLITDVGTKTLLGTITVNDSLSSSSLLSLSTFSINVKKNVVLNASVSGSGGIIFNGSTIQNIGGTSGNWGNFTVNNSNGLNCVTDINTDGLVTFTNGKLNTSSGAKLNLTASGTHAGASTGSYVNGPMTKTTSSTNAFVFPTGDVTTFRNFELIPSSANSTTWTGQYLASAFSNTSSVTVPLISVSNLEHVLLTRSGVSPADAKVKLYWATASGFADTIGLRVASWSGSSWTNAGKFSSTGNTTSGTITSNASSTFNAFTFGRVAGNTITTGTLTSISFCKGAAVSVPFTSIGTYNAGNIYTVQLSDASGNFASPLLIGTLTSNANSGSITAAIPFTVVDGFAYRLRIVSSNPSVIGSDNGTNFSITSPPVVSMVSTAGNSICASGITTLNVLVSGGNAPYTYLWNTGAITSSIQVGVGTYSATVTDANGCAGNYSITILSSICDVPTSISSSNITGTKATLTWTGNSCAVKYRIQIRVMGTTAWNTTAVNAPTTTKSYITLLPLTTYEYRVRSDCNSTGTIASAYSSIQTFTTLCNCEKPATINFTNIAQTTTTVNWTGNTCALKYRLQYRKQGVTAWTTATITAPTATKNLTALLSNSTYEIRMRSDCNATGSVNSGWTTTQTFTTALRLEDVAVNASGFELSIFPNPTEGKFVLNINSVVDGNGEIRISNILGQEIMNATIELKNRANNFNYSLENVSSGIYFVSLKTDDGVITKKLNINK